MERDEYHIEQHRELKPTWVMFEHVLKRLDTLEGEVRSLRHEVVVQALPRIIALEAQVRELQGLPDISEASSVWVKEPGGLRRVDNGDNAKCGCGLNTSGQHDEACPNHD